jgi:hypothetical protein
MAGEYEFEFTFPVGSDPKGALAAIELSFLPAPFEIILDDVTGLSRLCSRAKASEKENFEFLAAWSKNLYNFPADVMRACCQEWTWCRLPDPTAKSPFKFFPVWNEFLHGVYYGRDLVFRGLAARVARRALMRRVLVVSMQKYGVA